MGFFLAPIFFAIALFSPILHMIHYRRKAKSISRVKAEPAFNISRLTNTYFG